jgi:hypothetical protein
MRHIIVAASLLVVALTVTYAAATVIEGMAMSNKVADNEPFIIDKIRPATVVTRGPATAPSARSVNLAARNSGS